MLFLFLPRALHPGSLSSGEEPAALSLKTVSRAGLKAAQGRVVVNLQHVLYGVHAPF